MVKLQVSYENEGINKKLDDAITLIVKRFGYKLSASGFNLDTDERDISFEKRESND